MSPVTTRDLQAIMPRCEAMRWVTPLNAAMAEFGINSPARQAMFIAQIAHESGELGRVYENLNYSADGLLRVFNKYFPNRKIANEYARHAEAIANRVYANRMGNGDESSGDGWKYKGRGLIQLTGKKNYQKASEELAINLLDDPNYLVTDVGAARSAAWFFVTQADGIRLADKHDLETSTRRINGGLNGLDERKRYYAKACKVLGVS